MDANNEFSDEMSVAGGVAAAIAAFWALGNMDEVVEVADKMIQADAHIKSMEQDIAQLEQGAAQRMPVLRSKEQALAALQKDYEGVRSELSSLGGES
jgi:hypothetical protein